MALHTVLQNTSLIPHTQGGVGCGLLFCRTPYRLGLPIRGQVATYPRWGRLLGLFHVEHGADGGRNGLQYGVHKGAKVGWFVGCNIGLF